jgi:hypothetical protein
VTMLVDQFPAAFRQIAALSLDGSALEQPRFLRNQVLGLLPSIGYSVDMDGDELPVVLMHEDRLLPLLLVERSTASLPLIQFRPHKRGVTLLVFGPVASDRKVPYASFSIDCTAFIGDDAASLTDDLAGAIHRGIAVGVHSAEKFLRTSDPRHHGSLRQCPEAAALLRDRIGQNIRRCDVLSILLPALRPFTLFVGHDCYGQAVDVNLALGMEAPVVLLPKGKPSHFFPPGTDPGWWAPGAGVFHSHLHRWLSAELRHRWESIQPAFLDASRRLMAERLEDLSALPYMNVNYRDSTADSMVGWSNFQDALGVPVYEPDRSREDGPVHWIFALHSFADEAFRWGMDRLWSLYDLFLTAARHIHQVYPADRIVLRPHPNTLSIFVGPKRAWALRKLFERLDAGELHDLPTGYFDLSLQLRLCREITATGVECFLSSPVPTGELLRPRNSVVLTRHGSIVLEAAWLGRPSIFSEVAPYAFLFPAANRYSDAESLWQALNHGRTRAVAGTAEGPSHESLARYQAILDTAHGVPRAAGPGMLLAPTANHDPLRSFDDLAYRSESVSDAVRRLRSCLAAPQELAAFQQVLGCSS